MAELDDVSGVTPVVLIAGDGHHGWLNSAALAALGLGARDDVVRENEWFAAYELLSRAGRRRRHLARRPPRDARGGRRQGRGRPRRLRVHRRRRRLGRALDRRLRPAAGPGRDVRRPARGRDRGPAAHRRPASRRRRPDHDGPAEDHQRRLAQHPHGLVLRAVRRRRAARAPHRRRQPVRGRAAPRSWPAPTCPASRSPRTRSATPPWPPPWTPTPPPAPAARSSTPS